MSLTGLRTRRFGTDVNQSLGFVFVLGLGLTACGPQSSIENSAVKAEDPIAQSYQEWCAGWELNCPVAEPGKKDSLSPAQFHALSSILKSALASSSVFSVTRPELDAQGLKQAMTALHLDDIYQDVQARLDSIHWQSGRLENGALNSYHAALSSQRLDSGLLLNLDTTQRLAFTNGGIQLSGLGLSADAAKEAPAMQAMTMTPEGSFSWELSDRIVQQVPQDFALDTLLLAFGLDTGMLEGKEIALPDVIAAAAPLVTWMNQSSRQIVLDRSFFASTAKQVGVLLPEAEMGQALGSLLDKFDRMRTSSDSKSNLATVALLKGATAKCDMNKGEIKLKFSSEFGLKRIYQPGSNKLGLEFYGVEASAKKALGIGIKLKRVELSAEKITILDVPIIGKVELKLDEVTNPDQKTTLVCGA